MIDERARHDLHRALEHLLGTKAADTLMTLVPPAGWAGVTTTDDLRRLEARLDARLARERAGAEAALSRLAVGVEALEGRLARVDARSCQLEGELVRAIREHTRTLLLALLGAVVAMSAVSLGTVSLAG